MSAASGSTRELPPAEGARRRRLLIWAAVAAVAVALAVIAVLLLAGGDDDGEGDRPAAGAATTSSPTSSAPSPAPEPTATSPAPGATGDVNSPPPSLPPVPLDARGEVGNGISATLASIEAFQAEARGPGQIAGPALRITVRIENGTGEAVALDSVSVNAYYGAELTPASPLDDPSRSGLRGTLAPGESADGVYVFSVPESAHDSVTVEVGYTAGAPLLIFTGPVG